MTTRYFELAVRLFLIMPSANAMLCARKAPLYSNYNNVQGATLRMAGDGGG